MTTFDPFPRLPAELRIQIWEQAAWPRYVPVRQRSAQGGSSQTYTAAPVPGVLHACRESRRHSPYVRAFATDHPQGYTWVNFDQDRVRAEGALPLAALVGLLSAELPRIRHAAIDVREKVERYIGNGRRGYAMREFPALRSWEFILHGQPIEDWWGVWNDDGITLKCPGDRTVFVEEETGRSMTLRELRATGGTTRVKLLYRRQFALNQALREAWEEDSD